MDADLLRIAFWLVTGGVSLVGLALVARALGLIR